MYIYYQTVVFILAFLSSLADKKTRYIIALFLSIFVIVISGLRGESVGADDFKYIAYFKQAIESKDISTYLNDIYFEKGFTVFTYIQSNLFGYEFVFLMISMVTVIIAIYANAIIDRNNYILFSACYFITGFFWVGFVHVRFGLGISIFYLSYAYLYRNENYKAIILFGVALLMHNAIFLLVPVFFINKYYLIFNKTKLSIILFGSIFLKLMGFFKYLITFVISLGVLNPVYSVLFESKYSGMVSILQPGNLKFMIIALIILYSKSVYEKQCVFFIIYVSIMFVSSDINIISSRLSSILMFIEPFVVYTLMSKLNISKKVKYLFTLLYFGSYGLYLTEIKNILPIYEFINL